MIEREINTALKQFLSNLKAVATGRGDVGRLEDQCREVTDAFRHLRKFGDGTIDPSVLTEGLFDNSSTK